MRQKSILRPDRLRQVPAQFRWLDQRLGREHFLAGPPHAFEQVNGVPAEVLGDNCKTAGRSPPPGHPAGPQPRSLDFVRHAGFTIKAWGPRKAQEKGRAEQAVHDGKQNFLAGRPLAGLEASNAAARRRLDQVATGRVQGETQQTPNKLFALERPPRRALTGRPDDLATLHPVLVSRRARGPCATHRSAVPAASAGKNPLRKVHPDRLVLSPQDQRIAEQARRHDRPQDFEKAEPVAALLAQRRQARAPQRFSQFLELSPRARDCDQRPEEKRGNARPHVQQIVALSEIHGVEKVQRALEDAWAAQAFRCEYTAHLLEQRERPVTQPGALHPTRQPDLLDLPAPDLSLYESAPGAEP